MASIPSPSRRVLLQTAAGAAAFAAGASPASARTRRRGGESAELLRVGLVGCGGRGTDAAANALRADDNVKLVALGDVFADQLDKSLKTLSETEDIAAKVDVDEGHRFVGWDAYREVIGSCDVILLATSPHFRPLHLRAAVEADKHVFVEKPVATDARGVRSILETCGLARRKKLSIVSGLCYRFQNAKRETIQRLQDGAIGDYTSLQCTYNAGGLWHRGRKPEWSEMEYQMRNWLYFTWLAGDHIAEQHIHSLDKLAWAMGDVYPEKCVSSGGRIVRIGEEYGNVYDHFNTVYTWPGDIRGFSSCRQWNNAKTEVSDWVFGTRGRANIQSHSIEAGPWEWRYRSKEPDNMYQNEHDAFFSAIRADEPINNGEYMCKSTMMAIMGRMAAYTGQEITWEEAWNSELDLTPPNYGWGDAPAVVIARPGETEFV